MQNISLSAILVHRREKEQVISELLMATCSFPRPKPRADDFEDEEFEEDEEEALDLDGNIQQPLYVRGMIRIEQTWGSI